MNKYHVKLTFVEPLLGSTPMNKELYADYVATKAVDAPDDELETVVEMTEKGTTGFHRLLDGTPCLYDYVLKGFFKDACGMLRRDPDSASAKLKAFRKVIDGLTFVFPRQIPIQVKGEVGILERPLRAQTAQGERVALSRSETIGAGSSIEFDVLVLAEVKEAHLQEWLTYGALRGLGQWRNASYGRFEYELSAAQ